MLPTLRVHGDHWSRQSRKVPTSPGAGFLGVTERIVETKLTDLDDCVTQIRCGMRRGYWMARDAGVRVVERRPWSVA
jgi:hypothetical protein